MTIYNFYFDESSHDRAITHKDGKGLNIYLPSNNDLFVGLFWGFKQEKELEYLHQYSIIERYLKTIYGLDDSQEFKGSVIKQNNFKFGFNSFKPNTIKVYSNLFQLLDSEEVILHTHLYSKTEYLVTQYFKEINFPMGAINEKALIYSLTKFLFNYRNEEFLSGLFSSSSMSSKEFLEKLKSMLKTVIGNIPGIKRKEHELPALKEMLIILESAHIKTNPREKYEWDYKPLFIGLTKLLEELNIDINTVNLKIDPEGANRIVNVAKQQAFKLVSDEEDSSVNGLIRVADLLSNMFYRLTLALHESLKEDPFVNSDEHDYATKRILNEEWFNIKNEEIYQLYVSLNKILRTNNGNYWTTFSGIYFDYALLVFSLITYISENYESFKDFKSVTDKDHAEYFNTYVSLRLKDKFQDI
ncbi:hypothetical protein ACQKM9_17165 [Viridibacillus sp. NPDC093762]|uniref:hypothetical protein n=1 Tax=Viridibacillus sp. NPDC093762 TaxID=3390720 RepID=UPI003D01F786